MGVKEKFHKIWEKRPRTSKEAQARIQAFMISREGKIITWSVISGMLLSCVGLGAYAVTRSPNEGQTPTPTPKEALPAQPKTNVEYGAVVVQKEQAQAELGKHMTIIPNADFDYPMVGGKAHGYVGYNAKKPEIPMIGIVVEKDGEGVARIAFSEFSGEDSSLAVPTANYFKGVLKDATLDQVGFNIDSAIDVLLKEFPSGIVVAEPIYAVEPDTFDPSGFRRVGQPVSGNDRPRIVGIKIDGCEKVGTPIPPDAQGLAVMGMQCNKSVVVLFKDGKAAVQRLVEASFSTSPEQQSKLLDNKIKRHMSVLGLTTCENCAIRYIDNTIEALIQKRTGQNGTTKDVILSVLGADGQIVAYPMWKKQTGKIDGVIDGTSIRGVDGSITHNWNENTQEWVMTPEFAVKNFEIPKDHADYFWFNQGLSSFVVNINGRSEEFLSGQINCFPIGRRHKIQASSGVEMMFVDCIIQTPTGEKRKITLVFDILAYWKDLPPKNPQAIKIIQNSRDEELLQLIDEAISQKKQIGVDVSIAHKLSSSTKKECGLTCSYLSYAVGSSSSDLLDFFLSMGEAGKNIDILSVNGLYSEILQKTNLTESSMSQFKQILRSRGWLK